MLSMLYTLNDTLRYITPVFLFALSAALHAYAPHHRLGALERIESGRLTVTDAHRAALFFRWSPPVLAGLAAVLTGLSFWHSQQ